MNEEEFRAEISRLARIETERQLRALRRTTIGRPESLQIQLPTIALVYALGAMVDTHWVSWAISMIANLWLCAIALRWI